MAQNCNVSWGKFDLELWLLFVNQNSAITEVSNNNPHKCYAYNYNGHCSRLNCTYSHCCIRCFAAHPLIHCYVYKAKNMGGGSCSTCGVRETKILWFAYKATSAKFQFQGPAPNTKSSWSSYGSKVTAPLKLTS